MAYRPETEFGSLCGELLADLERFRPGLPADASSGTLRELLRARATTRLDELFRERRVDDGDSGADAETVQQLDLYRREVEQVLLPRYAELAERQNRHERDRSDAARGLDLQNRLTYGVIFFLIGLFVVWAPFIPIWEKWVPFALAALAPLFTPWLPDLPLLLGRRRHAMALGILTMDLDGAGRSLPLPPIGLGQTPTLPAAAGRKDSAPVAALPPRTPTAK